MSTGTDIAISTSQITLLKGDLEKVRMAAGDVSTVDLRLLPNTLSSRKVLVTHGDVIGRPIDELEAEHQSEIAITRVERAGVEFVPTPNLRLQFGDSVTVVGPEASLRKFSLALGNSEKKMTEPNVIGIFVGILVGVVIGSIPFQIPGLPGEIKLGLAGGPLIAGIVLSRLGSFGPIHWYLPTTANLAIREMGIALFLACVGLSSGRFFTREMMSPEMVWWIAGGAVITVTPLLVAGVMARAIFRVNYTAIAGLLAGSMTAPAALSFANTTTDSEAPAIAYATVYPLSMFLRVVTIQLLILFLRA
jgi:putative transport protein